MKGLILKDLYNVVRARLIIGALVCLFPFTAFSLATIDNVNKYALTELDSIVISIMALTVSYTCIVPFTSFLLNTMKSDYECGWLKIQRTMPVNAGEAIGAKLICTGIVIGFFTLIALIPNIILAISVPKTITELVIAGPFCIGMLQMTAIAPTFPLAMKLGIKATDGIYIAFVIIIAIILVIVAFSAFSNEFSAAAMRIIWYGALPAVTALATFISYKAGKNQIAKDL